MDSIGKVRAAGTQPVAGEATSVAKPGSATPFQVEAPQAPAATAPASPLAALRAGTIDQQGYIDAHITQATAHLSGLSPEKQQLVRDMLRELFDRHLVSLEAVGNVGTDNLDSLNTTLKRLERFWIDQVRFRL